METKHKKVFIQSTEELTLEMLAEKVSTIVDHNDVHLFIAMLEKMYESWEVTEHLIKHFKALEQIYNIEFKDEEKEDLTAKIIKYEF